MDVQQSVLTVSENKTELIPTYTQRDLNTTFCVLNNTYTGCRTVLLTKLWERPVCRVWTKTLMIQEMVLVSIWHQKKEWCHQWLNMWLVDIQITSTWPTLVLQHNYQPHKSSYPFKLSEVHFRRYSKMTDNYTRAYFQIYIQNPSEMFQ